MKNVHSIRIYRKFHEEGILTKKNEIRCNYVPCLRLNDILDKKGILSFSNYFLITFVTREHHHCLCSDKKGKKEKKKKNEILFLFFLSFLFYKDFTNVPVSHNRVIMYLALNVIVWWVRYTLLRR